MNLIISGIEVHISKEAIAQIVMERLGGAAPVGTFAIPAVGETWAAQGGRYAGLSLTDAGKPCHLIVAEEAPEDEKTWEAADKWARGLIVGDHRDFDLPNRHDGLVMYDNLAEHIEKVVHWLKTQHASDSGCAWYQGFDDGDQGYYRKDGKLRARAVRRLIIQ